MTTEGECGTDKKCKLPYEAASVVSESNKQYTQLQLSLIVIVYVPAFAEELRPTVLSLVQLQAEPDLKLGGKRPVVIGTPLHDLHEVEITFNGS